MADAKIVLSAVDQTKAAIEQAKRNLSGLGDTASNISSRLGSVGLAIGAAFSGASLMGVVEMLDRLDDMSEKTGLSAQSLSVLRYAGETTGTSFDSLAVGIRKLSVNMSEAAGGNKEAAATFSAMGVSVKNADGTLRSQEEVLGDLAERFAGYQDGAAKSALAIKVFGKSGEEMIPLLNLGRDGLANMANEAEQLGLVFGGDLAKAAADFNDNLTRIRLSGEGAKAEIAKGLLPTLNDLAQAMIETRKGGSSMASMLGEGLGIVLQTTAVLGANVAYVLKAIGTELGGLGAQAMAVARLDFGQAAEISRMMREDAQRNRQELEASERRLMGLQSNAGAGRGSVNPASLGAVGSIAQQTQAWKPQAPTVATPNKDGTAQSLINALTTEYANLSGQMSKVDEVTRKMDASNEKFTAGQRSQILTIAAQIDAWKRKQQVLESDIKGLQAWGDAQEAANNAYTENLQHLKDGAQTQQFEASLIGKTADQSERLRAERSLSREVAQAEAQVLDQVNAGLLTQIEATKRLADIKRFADEKRQAMDAAAAARRDPSSGVTLAINEYMEKVANAGDAAAEATRRTLSGMEDALIDFARTGKLSISGLVDEMINEFMRLNVVRPLMQSLFGPGGFNAGALVSSFFGGFRADGGSVSSSKAYIVGERGPELFFPGSSGFIAPNSALSGATAPVVNLNYTFNGPADATQVLTAAQLGAAMAEARIRDSMQRGRM